MKFIALAFSVLTAVTSFASSHSQHDYFFATFHFNETFWEMPIESVHVHAGIRSLNEKRGKDRPHHWQDRQDIELTRVGEHFWGKAKFTAFTGYNERQRWATDARDLGVSYKLTFVDGTEKWIGPYYHVDSGCWGYCREDVLNWMALSGAEKTGFFKLEKEYADLIMRDIEGF